MAAAYVAGDPILSAQAPSQRTASPSTLVWLWPTLLLVSLNAPRVGSMRYRPVATRKQILCQPPPAVVGLLQSGSGVRTPTVSACDQQTQRRRVRPPMARQPNASLNTR